MDFSEQRDSGFPQHEPRRAQFIALRDASVVRTGADTLESPLQQQHGDDRGLCTSVFRSVACGCREWAIALALQTNRASREARSRLWGV
mmetsp:Transcript_109336/g.326993  ORF Transcript_109336/g.326993 Transcript_109336/m.326993 type:complete len:89 (+) Transcript_109336:98-364(+)